MTKNDNSASIFHVQREIAVITYSREYYFLLMSFVYKAALNNFSCDFERHPLCFVPFYAKIPVSIILFCEADITAFVSQK